MSLMQPSLLAAMGKVAAGAETFGWGAKAAKTSTGTFTITLERALDAKERSQQLTLLSTAGANVSIAGSDTSATVITVTTASGAPTGALTDLDFTYCIFQAPKS